MNVQEINKIKEYIDNSKIVSFDIFDTLILRLVNKPEDIFKIIEENLNIPNFANKRVEFQQKASLRVEREKNYPHANIDEIYDFIGQNIDSIFNLEEVKRYELNLEFDSVVRNNEIYELYQYAKLKNKKVIAISDMYIKQKDINHMLLKCGYDNIDFVYVSADIRKTKYNGDLFEAMIQREKILPEQIFHIGDNYTADYINARNKGVKSFHYINENINQDKLELNVCNSINEGVINAIRTNFSGESFWFKLGSQVGGILYTGLINWLLELISHEKYEKIFFLSRDGYILYNILKEMGVKEIEYLYTSRRALLLAGIDKLDEESLNNLPPFTFGQTIDEILNYIDCNNISDESIVRAGFTSRYDRIINMNDFDKMKALYLDNSELVLKQCTIERKNAIKYFSSCGLLDSNAIIFDCGWNGSSQYLLDKLLNLIEYKGSNKFYYVGIKNCEKAHKQLFNKQFENYLFGFNYNTEIEKKLFHSIILVELFFCAPHASVLKYKETGPIFEDDESSHDYNKDIYRGILEYIKLAYNFFVKYNSDVIPNDSIKNLVKLIHNPNNMEAYNIGNLTNVDGFVSQNGQVKYIAKVSLKTLLKNPNIEIYWPQGIMARKDINPLIKQKISKKYNINMKSNMIVKSRTTKIINKFNKVFKIFLKEGPLTFHYLLKNKLKEKNKNLDVYYKWIEENEKEIYKTKDLNYAPKISIIVPVYNVLNNQLIECIESVLNQTYKNWELCLVDDASTWDSVRKVLSKYKKNDKIKIIYRKINGHISRATNDGISIATGEFIAFLDCDDILSPNALYEMVVKLNENVEYDFIYSDEDKLTVDGKRRHSPFFKPDWSPDTFMSLMYTCHFSMYRKSIVDEIGGLTVGLEGAQDYDFTLRFAEKAKCIGHVPKILYHWRERAESIASNPESKPYALDAVKKSKEAALQRRGLDGTVEYVEDMYQYRVVYKNESIPLISIIIPSKDNYDTLNICITSIKDNTNYYNYEIIVVDNGSNQLNRKNYEQLCLKYKCLYYYEEMKFNFSKMCNIGAELSNGSMLLFLNDDTEIINGKWLDILVGHASLNHVGAVGAKLLYPESTIIQHIGITNLKKAPCHSLIGFDDRYTYYYGRNRMDYNFIAVTGACLMIEKIKFKEVEGFNEELPIGYNDIDLCFKLIEHGYYNVTRNDAILYHHESLSRGLDSEDEGKQLRLLKECEKIYILHPYFRGIDPFYNVNLSSYKVNYDIKEETNLELNRYKVFNKTINENWYYSNLKFCIDSVSINEIISIEGWAFISNKYFNNINKIYIILIGDNDNKLLIESDKIYRPDVTNAFSRERNLNFSGFRCSCDFKKINKGKYSIALLVKNPLFNQLYFTETDKHIDIV